LPALTFLKEINEIDNEDLVESELIIQGTPIGIKAVKIIIIIFYNFF
jgi:hypothetical protein